VRDVVEKSLISLGQRRRWNSSNRRISYHERATAPDIQHQRSPILASHSHNSIIADAARDRPSRLISCGEAERQRCERGWADRAAHVWVEGSERAELGNGRGRIEREAGEIDGERGRAGIYGRREKRRGSAARAFPDRAAAKPRGQTAQLRFLF
jgi:hypothetical protein